jgi:hypothetical protein
MPRAWKGSLNSNIKHFDVERLLSLFGCFLFVLLFLSACASSKTPTISFNEPASRIHRITLEALADLNCVRIVDKDSYIKANFATGEVVTIYFKAVGPNETQLWVGSHTTYVGGAWQHERCEDVVWAIRHDLSLEPSLDK